MQGEGGRGWQDDRATRLAALRGAAAAVAVRRFPSPPRRSPGEEEAAAVPAVAGSAEIRAAIETTVRAIEEGLHAKDADVRGLRGRMARANLRAARALDADAAHLDSAAEALAADAAEAAAARYEADAAVLYEAAAEAEEEEEEALRFLGRRLASPSQASSSHLDSAAEVSSDRPPSSTPPSSPEDTPAAFGAAAPPEGGGRAAGVRDELLTAEHALEAATARNVLLAERLDAAEAAAVAALPAAVVLQASECSTGAPLACVAADAASELAALRAENERLQGYVDELRAGHQEGTGGGGCDGQSSAASECAEGGAVTPTRQAYAALQARCRNLESARRRLDDEIRRLLVEPSPRRREELLHGLQAAVAADSQLHEPAGAEQWSCTGCTTLQAALEDATQRTARVHAERDSLELAVRTLEECLRERSPVAQFRAESVASGTGSVSSQCAEASQSVTPQPSPCSSDASSQPEVGALLRQEAAVLNQRLSALHTSQQQDIAAAAMLTAETLQDSRSQRSQDTSRACLSVDGWLLHTCSPRDDADDATDDGHTPVLTESGYHRSPRNSTLFHTEYAWAQPVVEVKDSTPPPQLFTTASSQVRAQSWLHSDAAVHHDGGAPKASAAMTAATQVHEGVLLDDGHVCVVHGGLTVPLDHAAKHTSAPAADIASIVLLFETSWSHCVCADTDDVEAPKVTAAMLAATHSHEGVILDDGHVCLVNGGLTVPCPEAVMHTSASSDDPARVELFATSWSYSVRADAAAVFAPTTSAAMLAATHVHEGVILDDGHVCVVNGGLTVPRDYAVTHTSAPAVITSVELFETSWSHCLCVDAASVEAPKVSETRLPATHVHEGVLLRDGHVCVLHGGLTVPRHEAAMHTSAPAAVSASVELFETSWSHCVCADTSHITGPTTSAARLPATHVHEGVLLRDGHACVLHGGLTVPRHEAVPQTSAPAGDSESVELFETSWSHRMQSDTAEVAVQKPSAAMLAATHVHEGVIFDDGHVCVVNGGLTLPLDDVANRTFAPAADIACVELFETSWSYCWQPDADALEAPKASAAMLAETHVHEGVILDDGHVCIVHGGLTVPCDDAVVHTSAPAALIASVELFETLGQYSDSRPTRVHEGVLLDDGHISVVNGGLTVPRHEAVMDASAPAADIASVELFETSWSHCAFANAASVEAPKPSAATFAATHVHEGVILDDGHVCVVNGGLTVPRDYAVTHTSAPAVITSVELFETSWSHCLCVDAASVEAPKVSETRLPATHVHEGVLLRDGHVCVLHGGLTVPRHEAAMHTSAPAAVSASVELFETSWSHCVCADTSHITGPTTSAARLPATHVHEGVLLRDGHACVLHGGLTVPRHEAVPQTSAPAGDSESVELFETSWSHRMQSDTAEVAVQKPSAAMLAATHVHEGVIFDDGHVCVVNGGLTLPLDDVANRTFAPAADIACVELFETSWSYCWQPDADALEAPKASAAMLAETHVHEGVILDDGHVCIVHGGLTVPCDDAVVHTSAPAALIASVELFETLGQYSDSRPTRVHEGVLLDDGHISVVNGGLTVPRHEAVMDASAPAADIASVELFETSWSHCAFANAASVEAPKPSAATFAATHVHEGVILDDGHVCVVNGGLTVPRDYAVTHTSAPAVITSVELFETSWSHCLCVDAASVEAPKVSETRLPATHVHEGVLLRDGHVCVLHGGLTVPRHEAAMHTSAPAAVSASVELFETSWSHCVCADTSHITGPTTSAARLPATHVHEGVLLRDGHACVLHGGLTVPRHEAVPQTSAPAGDSESVELFETSWSHRMQSDTAEVAVQKPSAAMLAATHVHEGVIFDDGHVCVVNGGLTLPLDDVANRTFAPAADIACVELFETSWSYCWQPDADALEAPKASAAMLAETHVHEGVILDDGHVCIVHGGLTVPCDDAVVHTSAPAALIASVELFETLGQYSDSRPTRVHEGVLLDDGHISVVNGGLTVPRHEAVMDASAPAADIASVELFETSWSHCAFANAASVEAPKPSAATFAATHVHEGVILDDGHVCVVNGGLTVPRHEAVMHTSASSDDPARVELFATSWSYSVRADAAAVFAPTTSAAMLAATHVHEGLLLDDGHVCVVNGGLTLPLDAAVTHTSAPAADSVSVELFETSWSHCTQSGAARAEAQEAVLAAAHVHEGVLLDDGDVCVVHGGLTVPFDDAVKRPPAPTADLASTVQSNNDDVEAVKSRAAMLAATHVHDGVILDDGHVRVVHGGLTVSLDDTLKNTSAPAADIACVELFETSWSHCAFANAASVEAPKASAATFAATHVHEGVILDDGHVCIVNGGLTVPRHEAVIHTSAPAAVSASVELFETSWSHCVCADTVQVSAVAATLAATHVHEGVILDDGHVRVVNGGLTVPLHDAVNRTFSAALISGIELFETSWSHCMQTDAYDLEEVKVSAPVTAATQVHEGLLLDDGHVCVVNGGLTLPLHDAVMPTLAADLVCVELFETSWSHCICVDTASVEAPKASAAMFSPAHVHEGAILDDGHVCMVHGGLTVPLHDATAKHPSAPAGHLVCVELFETSWSHRFCVDTASVEAPEVSAATFAATHIHEGVILDDEHVCVVNGGLTVPCHEAVKLTSGLAADSVSVELFETSWSHCAFANAASVEAPKPSAAFAATHVHEGVILDDGHVCVVNGGLTVPCDEAVMHTSAPAAVSASVELFETSWSHCVCADTAHVAGPTTSAARLPATHVHEGVILDDGHVCVVNGGLTVPCDEAVMHTSAPAAVSASVELFETSWSHCVCADTAHVAGPTTSAARLPATHVHEGVILDDGHVCVVNGGLNIPRHESGEDTSGLAAHLVCVELFETSWSHCMQSDAASVEAPKAVAETLPATHAHEGVFLDDGHVCVVHGGLTVPRDDAATHTSAPAAFANAASVEAPKPSAAMFAATHVHEGVILDDGHVCVVHGGLTVPRDDTVHRSTAPAAGIAGLFAAPSSRSTQCDDVEAPQFNAAMLAAGHVHEGVFLDDGHVCVVNGGLTVPRHEAVMHTSAPAAVSASVELFETSWSHCVCADTSHITGPTTSAARLPATHVHEGVILDDGHVCVVNGGLTVPLHDAVKAPSAPRATARVELVETSWSHCVCADTDDVEAPKASAAMLTATHVHEDVISDDGHVRVVQSELTVPLDDAVVPAADLVCVELFETSWSHCMQSGDASVEAPKAVAATLAATHVHEGVLLHDGHVCVVHGGLTVPHHGAVTHTSAPAAALVELFATSWSHCFRVDTDVEAPKVSAATLTATQVHDGVLLDDGHISILHGSNIRSSGSSLDGDSDAPSGDPACRRLRQELLAEQQRLIDYVLLMRSRTTPLDDDVRSAGADACDRGLATSPPTSVAPDGSTPVPPVTDVARDASLAQLVSENEILGEKIRLLREASQSSVSEEVSADLLEMMSRHRRIEELVCSADDVDRDCAPLAGSSNCRSSGSASRGNAPTRQAMPDASPEYPSLLAPSNIELHTESWSHCMRRDVDVGHVVEAAPATDPEHSVNKAVHEASSVSAVEQAAAPVQLVGREHASKELQEACAEEAQLEERLAELRTERQLLSEGDDSSNEDAIEALERQIEDVSCAKERAGDDVARLVTEARSHSVSAAVCENTGVAPAPLVVTECSWSRPADLPASTPTDAVSPAAPVQLVGSEHASRELQEACAEEAQLEERLAELRTERQLLSEGDDSSNEDAIEALERQIEDVSCAKERAGDDVARLVTEARSHSVSAAVCENTGVAPAPLVVTECSWSRPADVRVANLFGLGDAAAPVQLVGSEHASRELQEACAEEAQLEERLAELRTERQLLSEGDDSSNKDAIEALERQIEDVSCAKERAGDDVARLVTEARSHSVSAAVCENTGVAPAPLVVTECSWSRPADLPASTPTDAVSPAAPVQLVGSEHASRELQEACAEEAQLEERLAELRTERQLLSEGDDSSNKDAIEALERQIEDVSCAKERAGEELLRLQAVEDIAAADRHEEPPPSATLPDDACGLSVVEWSWSRRAEGVPDVQPLFESSWSYLAPCLVTVLPDPATDVQPAGASGESESPRQMGVQLREAEQLLRRAEERYEAAVERTNKSTNGGAAASAADPPTAPTLLELSPSYSTSVVVSHRPHTLLRHSSLELKQCLSIPALRDVVQASPEETRHRVLAAAADLDRAEESWARRLEPSSEEPAGTLHRLPSDIFPPTPPDSSAGPHFHEPSQPARELSAVEASPVTGPSESVQKLLPTSSTSVVALQHSRVELSSSATELTQPIDISALADVVGETQLTTRGDVQAADADLQRARAFFNNCVQLRNSAPQPTYTPAPLLVSTWSHTTHAEIPLSSQDVGSDVVTRTAVADNRDYRSESLHEAESYLRRAERAYLDATAELAATAPVVRGENAGDDARLVSEARSHSVSAAVCENTGVAPAPLVVTECSWSRPADLPASTPTDAVSPAAPVQLVGSEHASRELQEACAEEAQLEERLAELRTERQLLSEGDDSSNEDAIEALERQIEDVSCAKERAGDDVARLVTEARSHSVSAAVCENTGVAPAPLVVTECSWSRPADVRVANLFGLGDAAAPVQLVGSEHASRELQEACAEEAQLEERLAELRTERQLLSEGDDSSNEDAIEALERQIEDVSCAKERAGDDVARLVTEARSHSVSAAVCENTGVAPAPLVVTECSWSRPADLPASTPTDAVSPAAPVQLVGSEHASRELQEACAEEAQLEERLAELRTERQLLSEGDDSSNKDAIEALERQIEDVSCAKERAGDDVARLVTEARSHSVSAAVCENTGVAPAPLVVTECSWSRPADLPASTPTDAVSPAAPVQLVGSEHASRELQEACAEEAQLEERLAELRTERQLLSEGDDSGCVLCEGTGRRRRCPPCHRGTFALRLCRRL